MSSSLLRSEDVPFVPDILYTDRQSAKYKRSYTLTNTTTDPQDIISKMSYATTPFAFTFGDGNASPVSSGMPTNNPPVGTINPADLQIRRDPTLPRQHPLTSTKAAGKRPESIRDMIPQNAAGFFAPQANPPAIPARQGAALPEVHHEVHQYMPRVASEILRSDDIPTQAPGFLIPGQQTGMVGGPGPMLGQVDAARRAEMGLQGQLLAEKKKLGPRGQKRSAEEAGVAAPAQKKEKKSGKRGPDAAEPGQMPRNACRKWHNRNCTEGELCGDDCLLKQEWRKVWDKESTFRWVTPDGAKKGQGADVWCMGLWSHMHRNANNFDGERRVQNASPRG